MANSTLKISFKLEDGANGLKQLTVDAEALRKVMGLNVRLPSVFESDFAELSRHKIYKIHPIS